MRRPQEVLKISFCRGLWPLRRVKSIRERRSPRSWVDLECVFIDLATILTKILYVLLSCVHHGAILFCVSSNYFSSKFEFLVWSKCVSCFHELKKNASRTTKKLQPAGWFLCGTLFFTPGLPVAVVQGPGPLV